MTDLSRPARDLLDALREDARTRKKWDGTYKTGVHLPQLRSAFRAVPRPVMDDELEAAALRRYLGELYRHGVVTAMNGDDGEKIPLPKGVWLLPMRKRVPKIKEQAPAWHPRMREAARHWDGARHRTRVGLRALNNWFLSDPDLTPVPIRERALDVFGSRAYSGYFEVEEKAFDELEGSFFSNQGALHELVQAYSTPPQLVTERLVQEGGGYYGQIGDGDVLLVVENVTTCWSLIEALDGTGDHSVGYVVCGMGKAFLASLASTKMLRRGKIAEIRYFGDLDPTGLHVPAVAAERAAKDRDLPDVLPAVGLYDALLRIGTPLPRKEKQQEADRVWWLDPSHRAQATALMYSEDRLAQEWVGLRHLNGNSYWLEGLHR
ncbi:hypothetical protein ACGFZS_11790 [Streptomyces sp. NPDC048288]|uniref:hypothetical protein n=1 Tax=Streptomyces sp. NPDC048288 TaxID=3365529 RepID=UPI003718AFA1